MWEVADIVVMFVIVILSGCIGFLLGILATFEDHKEWLQERNK